MSDDITFTLTQEEREALLRLLDFGPLSPPKLATREDAAILVALRGCLERSKA